MSLSTKKEEDTLASRLKAARQKKGYTQIQVAKAVPMAQTSYHQIESGYSKRSVFLNEIAKILGVTQDWLLYGEEGEDGGGAAKAFELKPKFVPILKWSAAHIWTGMASITDQDVIGQTSKPLDFSDSGFALRIETQNMFPDFKLGEIIYVEPQSTCDHLEDGSYLIVKRDSDSEAVFKQLVLGESSEDRYLRNLNPDLPSPRIVPFTDYHVVGVVVGKYVDYLKR